MIANIEEKILTKDIIVLEKILTRNDYDSDSYLKPGTKALVVNPSSRYNTKNTNKISIVAEENILEYFIFNNPSNINMHFIDANKDSFRLATKIEKDELKEIILKKLEGIKNRILTLLDTTYSSIYEKITVELIETIKEKGKDSIENIAAFLDTIAARN